MQSVETPVASNTPVVTQDNKFIPPVLKGKATQENTGSALSLGGKSKSTIRSYLIDLNLFTWWMLDVTPPVDQEDKFIYMSPRELEDILLSMHIDSQLIVLWIKTFGFQYKISTIRRKLSSISWGLKRLNLDDATKHPMVKETLQALNLLQNKFIDRLIDSKAIEREGFASPVKKESHFKEKQATPFRLHHLKLAIQFLDSQNTSKPHQVARDKALLSLLWHGLFRRSEIARLRIENLRFVDAGVFVQLHHSKTGKIQRSISLSKDKTVCPVALIKDWIALLRQQSRKTQDIDVVEVLFCSITKGDRININRQLDGRDVMEIIKRTSEKAGIDCDFSGHSPRSGAATEVYVKKRDGFAVQKAGGWVSDTWKRYVRQDDEERFEDGIGGIS